MNFYNDVDKQTGLYDSLNKVSIGTDTDPACVIAATWIFQLRQLGTVLIKDFY